MRVGRGRTLYDKINVAAVVLYIIPKCNAKLMVFGLILAFVACEILSDPVSMSTVPDCQCNKYLMR